MSLTIYGFNVVLKRDALDRVINGGSESFLTRVREARHGASLVTSDDHLVAVRFPVALLLEAHVKNLLRARLEMTADGKFADFAIVHAEHGLRIPCEWLEYERTGDKAVVWLAGTTRAPACYVDPGLFPEPLDAEVLCGSPVWVEGPWMTQIGHGFMLERNDGFNVMVDFRTGRTIINLQPVGSSPMK